MPTFREDLHLGHKVALIETDDIANGAITTDKIADGSITPEKLVDRWISKNQFASFVFTLDRPPFKLNVLIDINEEKFLQMIGGDISELVKAIRGNYFFYIKYGLRTYDAILGKENGVYKLRCDMDNDYLTISFKLNMDDMQFIEADQYLYSDTEARQEVETDIANVNY